MPLAGVTVRPATVDDAYRLADVVIAANDAQGRSPEMSAYERAGWREGFPDWSRQTVPASNPDDVLSVVELDAEAVGRLRVTRPTTAGPDGRPTRCVQLAGIQLVPWAQGHGVGTSIIRDLQDLAAREGIPLLIGVEKDNVDARRLYERLGCVPAGETDEEYLLWWPASQF